MQIKWAKRALRSLAAIAEYIERDSPSRARSFVQDIWQQIDLLTMQPAVGRPGRVMGTRELVVHANYIVVYRVKASELQILTVQHVAKRWPDVFD
ncbi:type II toxin-antitoxin system RelE/ParE family toxin [Burkholderiaceae bacterium DAT-1]|nr:type II toxin-antitoxin system RelE/ParE family toxin [Burkholderiaceae bacterium DAT-1]